MTREQMIENVWRSITSHGYHDTRGAANEIVNALLPQMTTVEDLEALPYGTVIAANNHALLRIPAGWSVTGMQGIWLSEWLMDEGPLTVVWQP